MTEVEHSAVLKSVVEASGGGLIDGVELLLKKPERAPLAVKV